MRGVLGNWHPYRDSLLPRSYARIPMALHCGWIAQHRRAEIRGFRVPRIERTGGLGSVYPPAGVIGRVCT